MTQQEKAKAYDEALKYARIYYTNGNEDMKMMMKTCFPVLVEESEDERIRKGIKSILEHYKESGEVVCPYPFVSIDEALVWLEKQGNKNTQVTFPTFTFEDVLALQCSMGLAKVTKDGNELYKLFVPLYTKIHNAYLDSKTEKASSELKNSEDEQHRKWIIEYLYDGLRKSDKQFKDQFKHAIAWLENSK